MIGNFHANILYNMSKKKVENNPNGVYFKVRRILAITFAILLISLALSTQIALIKNIKLPGVAKQLVMHSVGYGAILGVILIVYLAIATIHDITFEKIAKLAKQIIKIKK